MISEEANQMEEEEEEEEEEKEKSEMNYPNQKKKKSEINYQNQKKKNAVCTDGNTVYIFTRECKKKKHMGHIHEESIREIENTRTLVEINKNIV